MTEEMERYVALAHGVAAHATAGTLEPDTAMRFCRAILPSLLVELDIARRVEARLEQMFPSAPPAQQAQAPQKTVKRAGKKAAKKSRRKKGGHAHAS
jgi:hypothetical protein